MRPLITLIGAGPGDPELLTLKAARALGAADVVLVDELVNRGCLAHVRSTATVIEVEIVPGITSGTAVPASLGIPVTHRDLARGVTFVTGHSKDGTEPDWQALARSRTTLVVYMGLKRLQRILSSLRAAGMDPATPACIIENGTLHNQRQQLATIGTLSGDGFAGPALIVIGDVVRFARLPVAMPKAKAA